MSGNETKAKAQSLGSVVKAEAGPVGACSPDAGTGEGSYGPAVGSSQLQPGSPANRRFGAVAQFIKFGLVGVMNTCVDFLVYTVLVWAGVFYLAAQPISYAAGTLNSYVVNKLWTFKGSGVGKRSGAAARTEFLKFLALNGGTLLLSIVLLYGFKDGLGLPALWAKLVVTGFTVVVNYIGSKLWVFR